MGTDVERRIIKGLFTVPLKDIILVIVGLKGEAHGYEILKELEKLAIGLWKPSHSNLYTILNKMVEEGLLEPREEYRGRVRRVKYRLTPKGIEYLKTSNDLALRVLYTAANYHEALKKKLDPARSNGAVCLGLNGVVIKSHGGTDAAGFANAIGIAVDMAQSNLVEKIAHDLIAAKRTHQRASA